jgi:hypothetical protein
MSQPINDPTGVSTYQTNVANMTTPPDLKQLLDRQTAIAVQLANFPSAHPNYADLQARAATIAAAISAYKPRDDKKA